MNFYKHHIGDYAQATAHLSFVEDAAYSRMIRKYYAEEKPLPADVKAVQRLVAARTREERQAVADVLEEFFELRDDGWHNKRCDAELADNRTLDEDREARAANERERQRRHREERRRLFEDLRAFDIVPPWDAKTETLRRLLQEASGHAPVTPPVTDPVTRDSGEQSRPVTPPVTRTATANQTPDARHQIPERKERPPKPPGAVAPGFEEFWLAWPRKLAKADAEKAWRKLSPDDLLRARILRAVREQRGSDDWRKDGGRFIPHAATWLNGRRWEDQLALPDAAEPKPWAGAL